MLRSDLDPGDPVLGFVGTGTIASAIVIGLCSRRTWPRRIVLSPRSAKVASKLASRFNQVRVATSNQEVVDASDVVFLAVRPQLAEQAIAPLKFRAEQRIISLIATFSRDRVASLVSPAQAITCAVPQPTAAARMSPTAIFPPDPFTSMLFNRLGVTFEATTEREFQALFATTAAMASFFTLLDTLASWLVSQRIAPAVARDYITKMFHGLATVPDGSTLLLSELAAEFKTKGGLNEQVANELEGSGMFAAWSVALDNILKRITSTAQPADQDDPLTKT